MVSNIFYVHPYLGKIPILTIFFFRWVETTNQTIVVISPLIRSYFLGWAALQYPLRFPWMISKGFSRNRALCSLCMLHENWSLIDHFSYDHPHVWYELRPHQKACKHAKIAIWQRPFGFWLDDQTNIHHKVYHISRCSGYQTTSQPPVCSFKFWTAGFSGSWFGFLHHCCSNFGERKYVKGRFLPAKKLPEGGGGEVRVRRLGSISHIKKHSVCFLFRKNKKHSRDVRQESDSKTLDKLIGVSHDTWPFWISPWCCPLKVWHLIRNFMGYEAKKTKHIFPRTGANRYPIIH